MGNPVVAGAETVAGHGLDMWIRKYSAAQGNTVWTQGFDDPASKNDIAEGVAIDAADNVIIAGFDSQADQSTDVRLRKYSAAGSLLWTNAYNGALNSNDAANAVAIDASGAILVAGFETVNGQNANALLRKHAP
jgi:outer membrane protein assembly factor BamB